MVVNNWHRFPIHPSAFCIPPIVDGFIYAEITFLGDFSVDKTINDGRNTKSRGGIIYANY